MSVLKTAKQKLRSHIKAELQKISQRTIELQSKNVHDTLVKFPAFQNAKKVGIYMHMPHSEIRTLDIIQTCFNLGKQVYLPRCIFEQTYDRKKNHIQLLKVDAFQQVKELKPHGRFQLLEPTSGEDILESGGLDLLIVPGVAFTRDLKRLGHGGGFYDEFIQTYTKTHSHPIIIGIGLTHQLIDQIPTETHDKKLDAVIIDKDTYMT
ncbi:5-formyltetrahydrofolate cyclo-ligase [[Candida] jaroonii]|uniref:5-formyltetrahydrofolate cyclo-ligase n=1 Tax=[Candida] jaroonii TaxID=467808 RepID=A0ACA9Y7U9_9ASCO|nr:5-formyltetrahydrofolate cyclo-ligase [[Candida] jaroonii]